MGKIAQIGFKTTLENQAHLVQIKGKKDLKNQKKSYTVRFYTDKFWTVVQYKNTVCKQTQYQKYLCSTKMDYFREKQPNKALG